MIKDRMQELALLTKGSIIGSKLTKPLVSDPDWDMGLKDKIKQGQRLVSDINRTTEEINKLKQEYKKSIVQENEKEISKRLDIIVKKNHSDVENLNKVVKDIEGDAKRLTQKQKDSAEARTAEAAHQNLMTKMRLAINACTQAQQEFKTTAQEKIKRHIKIIDSSLTDDQVQTIAQSRQQGQKLLKQALFKDHSVQLQNAVSDIEDKYRDVVKLQQNINDCMKLMADLAVLVTYQGQLLNNIETILDQGKDYVQDADAKLRKAKEQHKSAQKKICCITVLILALIAIAVLIPVLITQVK